MDSKNDFYLLFLSLHRASKYCSKCHKDLQDPERMVKCKCRRKFYSLKACNSRHQNINLSFLSDLFYVRDF